MHTVEPLRHHPQPLALVVFLENVGHIHGLGLPRWAMGTIDFVTEEYAKLILRAYGVHRRYSRVIILEDAQARAEPLAAALLDASRNHRVDLLLLVHGQPGALVGYRGEHSVGLETFDRLLASYRADPTALNLRMVYGLNCYGASLATTWMNLGATVANGSVGVNWLPEPSLSTFLRSWLRGEPYSRSVELGYARACRWWRHVWRPDGRGRPHDFLRSSRPLVVGRRDITIDD